jgi:glycosyltransferase involved in cell wall biosynthesis
MNASSAVGTLNIGLQTSQVRAKGSLTLSVVIPSLNEENGIEDIVQRIQAARPGLQKVGVSGLEVIVVDDGSQDRTAEIVKGLPNTRLLQHSQNRGYGAAIKTGFSQARGELLAFLDADGTYPPEQFPALCQTLLEQKADVVVGSRRSGANSHMPKTRRLGNFIWSNLVSLLGSQRVNDPASGMRVVRREVLPRIYPLPDGLNFTPVMSTRSVHEKLKVVEIPISYAERVGDSKLTIVGDGTRFLTTILWTVLQYNPVRLFGAIGLFAMGIAGMIALTLFGLRLQGLNSLGPYGLFSFFTAVVLGVSGISLTSLGITFSYLVTLFHNEPAPQSPVKGHFFKKPLNYHFGWLGIVTILVGITFAIGSLILALNGWQITRLWFWLLSSALLILMGGQLAVSWIVMRVLEVLNQREADVEADIKGWMVK